MVILVHVLKPLHRSQAIFKLGPVTGDFERKIKNELGLSNFDLGIFKKKNSFLNISRSF